MKKRVWWLGVVLVAKLSMGWAAAPDNGLNKSETQRTALRVCQDPNNMPFSNIRGEGIENKLAELFGQALGTPVSYYSFPQRMGFIRNTLKFKLPEGDFPCDIVMGVPLGFDQVATTSAYYKSSYAMVFALAGELDNVNSVEEFLKINRSLQRKLRIGIYDRSPASVWLSRHGLEDAGVPYKLLNADPAQYPGEIIERDLARREIDVAIVWGPIAAYFAKQVKSPQLRVIPMRSEPGVALEFEMAVGVRHGEPAWKAQIESLLKSHQSQIRFILESFDVPLLEVPDEVAPR